MKKLARIEEDRTTYTLIVDDGEGELLKLLEFLRKCGSDGHSVSFQIDEERFGFDGDGSDKIFDIKQGSTKW